MIKENVRKTVNIWMNNSLITMEIVSVYVLVDNQSKRILKTIHVQLGAQGV